MFFTMISLCFSDPVHSDVESQVEPSMTNSCWSSRARTLGVCDSQVFCRHNPCTKQDGLPGATTESEPPPPQPSPPLPPQPGCVSFLCETNVGGSLVVDMSLHGEHAGAARRRRQRRIRSFWRHEQMAVQMVLATASHHSFDRVHAEYGAPRSQTIATKTGEEGHEARYLAPRRQKPPPLPVCGSLPASQAEPRGVVVKVTRHAAGSVDLVPLVQILDALVPQMVDKLMVAVQFLGQPGGRAAHRSAQDLLSIPRWSYGSP